MDVNNQNILLTYLNSLNPNHLPTININSNIHNTSRYNLKPKAQEILDAFGRGNTSIPFI